MVTDHAVTSLRSSRQFPVGPARSSGAQAARGTGWRGPAWREVTEACQKRARPRPAQRVAPQGLPRDVRWRPPPSGEERGWSPGTADDKAGSTAGVRDLLARHARAQEPG